MSLDNTLTVFAITTDQQFEWGLPQFTSAGFCTFESQSKFVDWKWSLAGIRFGSIQEPSVFLYVVALGYFLIVVPLTLISLWLLLSKPRKSTPKKTAEPIPEKVA